MVATPHYRRALQLFRLGSELLGKLPRRGDGPLDVLVKLLAIADAADKVYGGKTSAYASIFARYDLRERTSEPFVRIFFGTDLASAFKVRRHAIDEHQDLIEAVDERGERLFFQEYRWGRPEVSSDFFHTPGFDFGAAMATLWARYPTGLYLSVRPRSGGWGHEVTFCAVPPPRGETTSAVAAARIERGVAAHEARAGQPWCFIAYGPAGTGKSSYAVALARATGGRLLKMDAASLPHLGVQDVGFLLDVLRPTFLVVDDFDRAPVEDTRARVLFLFEHLHAAHAGVTVAVTVNDATKLDAALLRSERIDEAVEFALPDAEERREVLTTLMGKRPKTVERVVRATDGYSHADLAGLVRRLEHQPMAEALAQMAKLRELASKAGGKKDEKAHPKNAAETKAQPPEA